HHGSALPVEAEADQVMKRFQPPWSGGDFTARRVITPPQSDVASCALIPASRRRCAMICAELFMKSMLVACSSTTGRPSYPDFWNSSLALARFGASLNQAVFSSFSISVPQAKFDGHLR